MMQEIIQEVVEGWRTITYPISLQYRKEWGMWEAIREIKQNALDECGGFIETRYSDALEIRDKGKGLAVRHLLFGVSDKDGVTTRGKFAEGLKIAMVVCLRNGYPVHIRSNRLEIVTQVGKIENEPVLQVKYRYTRPIKGTKVTIMGYTGPSYNERFTIGKAKLFTYGKSHIIEGGGNLYVKNIWVAPLKDSMFSYDLWDVRLSESRGIASEWDVHSEIGRIWSVVDSVDLFIKLFQALKAGMYEAKCDFWWTFDCPDKLTKAFHIVFGENAVIQTSQEAANEALWLGANPVTLPKNISGILKCTTLSDVSFVKLRHANSDAREVPEDKLTVEQLGILNWLRKFPKHLTTRKVIIKPFILSDDDAQALSIGKTCVIRISTRILAHRHAALAALIHELAHAEGAKDMTPEMILRVARLGATAYLNKEEIER